MEQILNGCERCSVYIDDIIVYGITKQQHDNRLNVVLQRLKEYNVMLNDNKCVFGAVSITFLGHNLSSDGIKPANDKMESIRQFRDPSTAEETRSFLGLVNYVGKFIPNLATLTEPLRRLIKTGVPFIWGQEQSEAYSELKKCLTANTTLGYYNTRDHTQLVADASPIGLGAVLIQFDEKGSRVISYASRSLSDVEMKYAQTEKEAHKFKVIYKPGKTNIADPLSRLLTIQVESPTSLENEDSKYIKWILSHAEPKAMSI